MFQAAILILCFLLYIFDGPPASGQTLPNLTASDQLGIQPNGSYHGGDIDAVGLTNGTLTLNSPFLSYPQRGNLQLSFDLMYSNLPQHYGQRCVTPDPCYFL
jgi:hypothetical protein